MHNEFQIVAAKGTWVVRAAGAVIGESASALELHRGDDGQPIIFFPREDLGMEFFDPSNTTAQDAAIGEARYFHIAAKSGLIRDAGWSFQSPAPDAARLAGCIAFARDKVTLELI